MDLSIRDQEQIWHWRIFWAVFSMDLIEPFVPAFGLDRKAGADLRGPARVFTTGMNELMARRESNNDGPAIEALLLRCFREIAKTHELPFAERIYTIAVRDFPDSSRSHIASAWLTVVLPNLKKATWAERLGVPEATKRFLRNAVADWNVAMSPWDQLDDDIEAAGPSSPWDIAMCAPGAFYRDPRDVFNPTDWVWDAIRWVHFRHLWRRIEAQFSAEEMRILVQWASQILSETGGPEAQIPSF